MLTRPIRWGAIVGGAFAAEIFPRAFATPGYRFVGLPAVEIYQTQRVNARRRLNHTDICLPVVRR